MTKEQEILVKKLEERGDILSLLLVYEIRELDRQIKELDRLLKGN